MRLLLWVPYFLFFGVLYWLVLSTIPAEGEELKIRIAHVQGVRALKSAEVRKAARLAKRDFLSKATDRSIEVHFVRLKSTPCDYLNTLAPPYNLYRCLHDYTDSLNLGIGYDTLYVMMPPIIDSNRTEWVQGMGWICANFSIGNAVKKVYPGAQFADRWRLSIIPLSHELLHNLGARHIDGSGVDNIMCGDAGYRASINPWPLPVLEETKQEIKECLG